MKTMKKFLSLVIALVIVFSVCACQQKPSSNGEALSGENNASETTDSEGIIAVTNAQELMDAFADLMTDDIIRLEADIDMTGQSLAVVNTRAFTLDGNGHTISNYHVEGKSGLFVDSAGDRCYTIQDLTLKNCSVVSDDDHAALFIGGARDTDTVTISNCHAIDCSVTGKKYAAVFVAYTAGTDKGSGEAVTMTVKDCSATGCSVTGGGSTGIAIGHSGGNDITANVIKNITIKDCTVTGEDAVHEGIVIGTAGSGTTEISNVIVENVTTAHNQEAEERRYYGRNLTDLLIDGEPQDLTNS